MAQAMTNEINWKRLKKNISTAREFLTYDFQYESYFFISKRFEVHIFLQLVLLTETIQHGKTIFVFTGKTIWFAKFIF